MLLAEMYVQYDFISHRQLSGINCDTDGYLSIPSQNTNCLPCTVNVCHVGCQALIRSVEPIDSIPQWRLDSANMAVFCDREGHEILWY